jgi:pyruvate/2-oxoglutarate dehydrogenase complex dihydrolipoamide acyltransferase (E2) component
MPIELKMPALSPTTEKGALARWLVEKAVDGVSVGTVIAMIAGESETVAQDISAPEQ